MLCFLCTKYVSLKKEIHGCYVFIQCYAKTTVSIPEGKISKLNNFSYNSYKQPDLAFQFHIFILHNTFELLFISYKFVKGFLAIVFLFLVFFSSWNLHDVCQCFLYNQKQKFSWIRQKMRNFPIDPHYKNRLLL